jgi:hypothetical protein
MKKGRTSKIIRNIGLALNVTHNTIATDRPEVAAIHGTSWRVDHSKEIEQLEEIESILLSNNDTCPLCGHCNNHHANQR